MTVQRRGNFGRHWPEQQCQRLDDCEVINKRDNLSNSSISDDNVVQFSMNTAQEQQEFATLYSRAFAEYGTHALWNMRRHDRPTEGDALVVARALRIEGDRSARKLAEQIERACRAAV